MAIPKETASGNRPKKHGSRQRRHVWKDKHWRWVPDGNGDWVVEGYIFRHHHKPAKNHFRGPGPKPARRPSPAKPSIAVALNPDPRPAGTYCSPAP